MSDPADLLPVGGAGGLGVAVAMAAARLWKSNDVSDLKHEFKADMAELKQEMKVGLAEQRADFREQFAALLKLMERNDDRHGKAMDSVSDLRREVASLHQRLDMMEREIQGIVGAGR